MFENKKLEDEEVKSPISYRDSVQKRIDEVKAFKKEIDLKCDKIIKSLARTIADFETARDTTALINSTYNSDLHTFDDVNYIEEK